MVGIRWWLVLANLQLGAIDEAERWLEESARTSAHTDVVAFTYGLGVRAEILLARGEVTAGLGLWGHAVDQLRVADDGASIADALGLELWKAEAEAVAVVAHAQHGRLDLVTEVVAELPAKLSAALAAPVSQPFLVDLPIHGALLLTLAMVDIASGERASDDRVTRSGARMVALAERFRFLRAFQPTVVSRSVSGTTGFLLRIDPTARCDATFRITSWLRDSERHDPGEVPLERFSVVLR